MGWRTNTVAMTVALGIANAACSTTATVYRRGAPPVEASIVGGTADSILLERNGNLASVPRGAVTDVNHPGDVHALIGGGILSYGILNIAVGLPKCQDETQFSSSGERNGFCMACSYQLHLAPGCSSGAS